MATLTQHRVLNTSIPGPKSLEIDKRRKATVAAGVSIAVPVYAESASAGIIRDVDGNQFIDLSSGIGVTTVGHSDPDVTKAVIDQIQHFSHTMFPVAPYESFIEVIEKLVAVAPVPAGSKGLLLNTGSEAIENAVKMARHFTGRSEVAVLDHSYHGRTNLTMAMTYKVNPYRLGFGPFAPGVHSVPNSYPFRDGLSGEEAAKRTIQVLEKHVGADQLACIVAEPIQGEGGFIVPADGYLKAISDWAHAHGVIVVADEVQSGVARTGKWFCSEYSEGFTPDLVAIAKGIGGGLPLAAVVGRADIMDHPQAGGLGGTFVGNPLSCAAALAVINKVERDDLAGQALRVEAHLLPALKKLQAEFDIVGDVRGRGAMLAIELVDPATNEPNAKAQAAIVDYCVHNGVILLSAGTYSNVIRFLPNLAVSDALLDEALEVLHEAFIAYTTK